MMARNGSDVTSVHLELGSRLAQSRPRPAGYPPEVEARLASDAAIIIARYPHPRSALLPLLHLVQSEDGCVTDTGIGFCARLLGLTAAEVSAVSSFYSMYRRNPAGRHLVGVCTNTLCAIMGGDAILDALRVHLAVDPGQTTTDGSVTLEHVECNAACDYAPVVMVNWQFHDRQTCATATALVDSLRGRAPVPPSRGGAPCTFRDASRELAGLPPEVT